MGNCFCCKRNSKRYEITIIDYNTKDSNDKESLCNAFPHFKHHYQTFDDDGRSYEKIE